MKGKKGFQKGNRLAPGGKKGVVIQRIRDWHNLGDFMIREGSEKYLELLQQLKQQAIIEEGMSYDEFRKKMEAGREFMDRFENLLEYFKPKLARTEMTDAEGKPLLPLETLKKILGIKN